MSPSLPARIASHPAVAGRALPPASAMTFAATLTTTTTITTGSGWVCVRE